MPPSSKSTSRNSSAKTARTNPEHLPDFELIQKWSIVQNQLIKSLGLQKLNSKEIESSKNQPSQAPITLSHGFQTVRKMEHARAEVRLAQYVPNSSSFISIDKEFVHSWKSGIHIQKQSLAPPSETNGAKEAKKKAVQGLWNVTKWIYIEKFHIYVIANQQLELKVLDLHFDTMNTFSNPKPVLTMEYSKATDSIFSGEIGSIRVFDLVKSNSYHMVIYILKERMEITEGLEDEWVSSIYYDRTKNRIFAGCGSSVFVYDFLTGKLVDRYLEIHPLSITSIVYYEPAEYLITGSKDGTIKVWNARKAELYEFHGHYNSITGFLLMETICESEKGTLSLLVSSSLDGTIRMWNFETGQSLYRLDTEGPCLGIGLVKKNHFYHFTSSTIHMWNVNRYHHTFAMFRSRPRTLERFEHPLKASRIVTAVTDGSIRLVSPITGTVIATGFPTDKDFQVLQAVYDLESELIYCLNSDNSIIQYGANTNPFSVESIWENARDLNREVINCICGLDLYNNEHQKREARKSFLVFGGTSGGQIHLLNFKEKLKQEPLVQAHSNQVSEIRYNSKAGNLISFTSDGTIKVWSIAFALKKETGLQTRERGEKLVITLSCIHSVTCELHDQFLYGICFLNQSIAFSDHLGIKVFNYCTFQSYVQERKENIRPLQLVSSKKGGFWAVSHDDHTVKVYDHSGTIVREVQFNESISCVSFVNSRGDLLVGLSDQLTLVRIQDYLTSNVLRKMAFDEYTDDELEDPINFDDGKETEEEVVQVSESERPPDDAKIMNLLALSRVRKEEARLRRNKRRFLETERANYDLEVEIMRKKEELMKRLDEARKRKEEKIRALQEVQRQEEEQFKLLGFDTDDPDVRGHFLSTNALNEIPAELEKVEFSDAMMLLDRSEEESGTDDSDNFDQKMELFFRKRMNSLPRLSLKPFTSADNLKSSKQPTEVNDPEKEKHQRLLLAKLEESTLKGQTPVPSINVAMTDEEVVHEDGKKRVKSKRRKTFVKRKDKVSNIASLGPNTGPKQRKESRLKVDLRDDDDATSTSGVSQDGEKVEPVKIQLQDEEMFVLDAEKEEMHQKLVHISSEQYQKDLKDLKALTDKSDNDEIVKDDDVDRPRYTPGTVLPNSVALPEILPMFYGKQVLNRGEQLFQKYDLNQMYRRPSKPLLQVPPVSYSKKLFRKPTLREGVDLEEDPDFVPGEYADGDLVEIQPEANDNRKGLLPAGSLVIPVPQVSKNQEGDEGDDLDDAKRLMEQYILEASENEKKTKKKKDKKMKQKADLEEKRRKKEEEVASILPAIEDMEVMGKVEPLSKSPLPTVHLGDKVTKKILKTHGLDRRTSLKPVTTDITRRKSIIPDFLKKAKTPSNNEEKQKPEKRPTTTIPSVPKTNVHPKIPTPVVVKSADPPKPKKEYKFESLNLAEPILKVLGDTAPSIQGPMTIEKISSSLNTVLHSQNPVKIKEAANAIVSLYKMFEHDLTTENKFDMFIAPFLDKFQNENPTIRNVILQSIVQVGIQHDNVLVLLITALADRNSEVKSTAIKGLGQFGIADKEALKRAMMELGMIKGKVHKYSNALIDRIALEKELEFQSFLKRNDQTVGQWLAKTPAPPKPPVLERKDSYFEHLAGKFFPPDDHDFEGKQRVKVMMIEATKNYDDYWREHNLTKEDDFFDLQASIREWESHEMALPVQKIEPKPRSVTSATRVRVRPEPPKKRETSANIALRMTRALTATPVRSVQAKLARPFTAATKSKLNWNRPQTSY